MNQHQENPEDHFEKLAKKDPLLREYLIVRNAFLEKYAMKKPHQEEKKTN